MPASRSARSPRSNFSAASSPPGGGLELVAVGQRVTHRLVSADRLAELHALLRVAPGLVDGRLHEPDAAERELDLATS
jgi:hypothetical protein